MINLDSRNNKVTAVALALASIAMLSLSGGTFALWNDSKTQEVGELVNGNLAVVRVDSGVWQDVSNGSNSGQISLADFRAIPGDELQGMFAIDVALQGDNMTADLTLTNGNQNLSQGEENGLEFVYTLMDSQNQVATFADGTPVAQNVDEFPVVHLVSQENTGADPNTTLTVGNDTGRDDFYLKVNVLFDRNQSGNMGRATDIDNIKVGLSQTR